MHRYTPTYQDIHKYTQPPLQSLSNHGGMGSTIFVGLRFGLFRICSLPYDTVNLIALWSSSSYVYRVQKNIKNPELHEGEPGLDYKLYIA